MHKIVWIFLAANLKLSAYCDAKKSAKLKGETCVNGYCLGSGYNKLELPRELNHVKMNLEVSLDNFQPIKPGAWPLELDNQSVSA